MHPGPSTSTHGKRWLPVRGGEAAGSCRRGTVSGDLDGFSFETSGVLGFFVFFLRSGFQAFLGFYVWI